MQFRVEMNFGYFHKIWLYFSIIVDISIPYDDNCKVMSDEIVFFGKIGPKNFFGEKVDME